MEITIDNAPQLTAGAYNTAFNQQFPGFIPSSLSSFFLYCRLVSGFFFTDLTHLQNHS